VSESIFALVEHMVSYVRSMSGEESSDEDLVRLNGDAAPAQDQGSCCFAGGSHQAKFE